MLDIKYIREHPQEVEEAAKNKGASVHIGHLLEIDGKLREIAAEVQKLQEEKNVAAKNRDIEKGKEIKTQLDTKEAARNSLKNELDTIMLTIPNPAKADVKVGKD